MPPDISSTPPPQESQPDHEVRLPWSLSDRPVPRLVLRPLQAFLHTEAAGGLLLLGAAVAALAWANSPWANSYERFWHTTLGLRLGRWSMALDLRHWVNDALMAIFFFVVGLEIKRELVTGELRDRRAAALPLFAALGGMVVPALIYAVINAGGAGARGWGIPMATDIAFGLGVLALVGRRVPLALKSFLLALAIVDDIGAIGVIAVFYSGPISWEAFGLAAVLLASIGLLQRLQVTWMPVYVFLGVAVWVAVHASGIHATIAGVALGLLTPAIPFQRPRAVSEEANRVADETDDEPSPADADAHHWLRLADLSRQAVSPLGRLESALHPWTSFLIVPLFALANSGISLRAGTIEQATGSRIALGIVIGLVAGKAAGISLASWLAVKSRVATLPEEVRWTHILGVSAVAGIGFTVSLFIAALAFDDQASQDIAKVGILAASVLAGVIGVALLRAAGRKTASPPA